MEAQHLPGWAVDGVASRDPDAVALCYDAFADPLFRYLLSRCGDRTLAEDLVEATFLELVEHAPTLTGGASGLRAWLFRAGRNNLLDHVRKAQRRGDQALDEQQVAILPALEAGPEALALGAVTAGIVREALEQISPDQREVLLLRFAGGLTGPETAEVTDRTLGAVKALQHRGLRALQRALAAHPDLGDPV